MPKMYNKAFSIILAIFILVILALIASFLVGIFVKIKASNNMFLQGQRAYFAAKSGLEWGIFKVAANPLDPCFVTTNLNLTQQGLSGFVVNVSCNKIGSVFTITAVASKGVFGELGYVTKTLVDTHS